jgi:putative ABC transport system ATP-binding protein
VRFTETVERPGTTERSEALRTNTGLVNPVPVLTAGGIGRRNPRGRGWLLRGVSLELLLGDRLVISGPSGAGKTVLLRALALLDPLDVGTIHWNGGPLRCEAIPSFRSQVVYLHQRPALFEGSVEENLEHPYSLNVYGGRRFDRDRVVDLLKDLGRAEPFLDKLARDLSGGEGQIVALLRALQLDPAILLLDEPTSSLDREIAGAVEALLGRWHAEGVGGRAFVWVTHDRDQARRVAEGTWCMRAGCLKLEP